MFSNVFLSAQLEINSELERDDPEKASLKLSYSVKGAIIVFLRLQPVI